MFTCDPAAQQTSLILDSSVLYPPVYKYTKPDSEFIFEENETDSDSDTMSKVKVHHQDNSAKLANLLKIDFSDVQITDDFEELHIDAKDNKSLVAKHTRHSVIDNEDDHFDLRLVRKKLRTFTARKRTIAESINFHEQVLKKLKTEYAFYEEECEVLNTQFDLQTTLKYTRDKKHILPDRTVKTLNKIESDLAEQKDIIVKKEVTDETQEEKNSVQKHVTFSDLPKNKHWCKICGNGFAQTTSFKDHLKAHTGFSYKCEKCLKERRFTSTKAFKKHCKWHEDGEKMFTCKLCSKQFEYMYRLTSHQATHEEPSLECTVHNSCGKDGKPKKFTFRRELLLHERYSKKEKMFKCTTCEKLFTSPRTIHIHHHKNAHSGMRQINMGTE